jgi:hypothetical protein
MSHSTTSSTLAAYVFCLHSKPPPPLTTNLRFDRITGNFTNAQLNLAGSGGYGPEDEVILLSVSLRNLPVLDTLGTVDPYLRISSRKGKGSWVQRRCVATFEVVYCGEMAG